MIKTISLRNLDSARGQVKKHIMFSYCWSNKDRVDTIYQMLSNEIDITNKYNFWIDSRNLTTGILRKNLEKAVLKSALVLIFLSSSYAKSTNCKIEADYIIKNNIPFIPIIVEQGFPYDFVFNQLIKKLPTRVRTSPSPLIRRRENVKSLNWIHKYFGEYLYIDMSGLIINQGSYDMLVENIKFQLNISNIAETEFEDFLEKDEKIKIERDRDKVNREPTKRRLSHEETQDFRDLIHDTPRTDKSLCLIFNIDLTDAIEIIKDANKDFNPDETTIS